jgi:phosphatidylglycerol lysyltransferase
VGHVLEPIATARRGSARAEPEQPGGPFPDGERRHWMSVPGLAWRQLSRAPATACYLALVWVVGLATGSVAQGPPRWLSGHVGAGLPSLGHGYWWTPLSACLWAPDLGGYLVMTVLAGLILAPAERRLGVVRTFATLLASEAIGLLLAAGLIELGELVHEPWLRSMAGQTAFGPLPGLLGVGYALSCTLTVLWRRRLRLLITAAVTIGVMYLGHLEQVAQACGAAAGFASATLACDLAWPWAAQRRSKHEVRVLVGLLVAAPAVGGVVAALVANADGPMSLSFPFAAPALLLLLSAYGLRRGRRLAWWLAIVSNVTLLAAAIRIAYGTGSRLGGQVTSMQAGGRATVLSREAMVLPVVTLTVLLVTRRRFDQVADRQAAGKLAAIVAAAFGASLGAFLLLGYLLRDQAGARPGVGGVLQELSASFLPGRLFGSRVLPHDLAGRLLFGWVFLLFWTVVLGALAASLLRTCVFHETAEADQARAILTCGGSTLSYMSTWPGNKYWISSDGRAAIAYRAIGTVAVTVGDPFGEQAGLDSVIAEFARFCEDRGLLPCLYSATGQSRAAAQRLGWSSVQIAEDTLLPLESLQFAGKKWQGVRAAMNKAAKEGITAQWWSFRDMPPDIAAQIRQISGSWVADKGLPEMGFMLGGLAQLHDPDIRCLLAVGADRTVHGVTSWMPVYADGRPVGWTIDFMRRSPDPGTCRGVMEFLIATAAQAFREEGARFVSLSAAPLARLDRSEQPRAVQGLLDMIGSAIEPVYGFRSLLRFKAKFQPVYEPLYLIYPDPAALGPIVIAIGRAYLPHLTSRQALRLLAKLRWSPATAVAGGGQPNPSPASGPTAAESGGGPPGRRPKRSRREPVEGLAASWPARTVTPAPRETSTPA